MAGNLTRDEARERARLLKVRSYDVALDLTEGEERFESVTTIRFDATTAGAETFVDLARAHLRSVTLISDTLGRSVRVRVSANALKTVDHRGGLDAFLLKASDEDLAPKMRVLKRAIVKKRAEA